MTYGNGVFVAAGKTTDGSSPGKYSLDGQTWSNTDILPQTNSTRGCAGYLGVSSDSYHTSGNLFILPGTNPPATAANWLNITINMITFNSNSGTFITVGKGWGGTLYQLSENQLTILNSTNGSNWNCSYTGGFFSFNKGSNIICEGYANDYGPLSIIPNMSTIYMEINKGIYARFPIFEIKVYSPTSPLTPQSNNQIYNVSSIYDGNLATYWWPSDSLVSAFSLSNYNLTLNFSTVISSFSKLTFYTPLDNTRQFTGLVASLLPNDQIVYNNPIITSLNFNYDPVNNLNYFEAIMLPALSNISTLYLNIIKTTATSPQINEILAVNDPNQPITQYNATSVVDLDNWPSSSNIVSNTIDGNLATFWGPIRQLNTPNFSYTYYYEPVSDFITNGIYVYRTNYTFQVPVPRISFIRIYNALNSFSAQWVSGVIIYSDSNKTSLLYSNVLSNNPFITNAPGVQIGEYHAIDCSIIPIENASQIYIEFQGMSVNGNYGYNPYINEVQFYNIGRITDTPAGYTGGTVATMARNTLGPYLYDGGGGSNGIGGVGGTYIVDASNTPSFTAVNGLDGTYLTGGSPASAGEPSGATSYNQIIFGAGGGGGGYYGGGGGAVASFNKSGTGLFEGGGGGGGAGYFLSSPTLLTLLEYGVAIPGNTSTNTPSNYIPPRLSLQTALVGSNLMPAFTNTYGYGAGGIQAEGSGQGAHGAVLINFDQIATVIPNGNSNANPKYLDGDKQALFTCPITYDTDRRALEFTTYSDPVQYSIFSNYNWVWYRSFLLLTGTTLNPATMTANSLLPSNPTKEFPNLPSIVYFGIQQQFSNVSSFFGGISSISNVITQGLQISFETHNQLFINTLYTDPKYVEFTEIYCLLDYLRQPANLLNPHVDVITSPLSRVFGGLPRFGYWANPFLTNVSYVGFDVGPSLMPPQSLSSITRSSDIVQAFYGLALEQSLSSGRYILKDIMAYKPSVKDASNFGSNWLRATQFTDSYIIREFNALYLNSNLSVQPYTMASAIEGRMSMFNYKIYTTPVTINGATVDAPIQMINDFQGQSVYLYTYQNSNAADISTIHLTQIPMTSTIIQVNQTNVTTLSNAASNIIGTVTYENFRNTNPSTSVKAITQFGFDLAQSNAFNPILNFTVGSNNYFNNYSVNSKIAASNVGKAISDVFGNLYVADRLGGSKLYENVCTIQIYQESFSNAPLKFASPSFNLAEYKAGIQAPFYDFFVSKYRNIWHLQGTQNLSTIYGVRLDSPFDFSITTSFANQIFYPTHKIILTQKGVSANPITNTYDLIDYPSYPRTEMFFYRNYSTLVRDISGQFALEKSSNFAYADTKFSGYFFNSFIQNINMEESTNFNNANPNSFNYLAIRAYSPSETFKTLVRFYLPGRYDFGYISVEDLSNEVLTLQGNSNVNSEYLTVLGLFTSTFALSRVFGGTGLPGFSGSNVSSITFGGFLQQYSTVSAVINSNSVPVSTIGGQVLQGQRALITGDLQNIIPAYVATRERVYDPLEFSLPFSTIAQASNRTIEEYSIGYNLGFIQADTPFNTVQRAGSFFKILDDYIYMKMNEEYNMNRLDISRQEDLSVSHDTQAESQLYICKLLLNNFGTYATTVVQNPVLFNPPIGKLDKLSFSWYDKTGVIINNDECEWSGSIQVVESMDLATNDSSIPKL